MASSTLYSPLSSGEKSAVAVRQLDADQSFEVHDGEDTIPTTIPKTENWNLTAQFVSRRFTHLYVTT